MQTPAADQLLCWGGGGGLIVVGRDTIAALAGVGDFVGIRCLVPRSPSLAHVPCFSTVGTPLLPCALRAPTPSTPHHMTIALLCLRSPRISSHVHRSASKDASALSGVTWDSSACRASNSSALPALHGPLSGGKLSTCATGECDSVTCAALAWPGLALPCLAWPGLAGPGLAGPGLAYTLPIPRGVADLAAPAVVTNTCTHTATTTISSNPLARDASASRTSYGAWCSLFWRSCRDVRAAASCICDCAKASTESRLCRHRRPRAQCCGT